MTSNLIKMVDDYETAYRQFHKNLSEQFDIALKEVFDRHPEIRAFCWVQYTDFFNDGEPCRFGVRDINAIPEWIIEESGDTLIDIAWCVTMAGDWEYIEAGDICYDENIKDKLWPTGEVREVARRTCSDLSDLPSEFFENRWGDHAFIIVAREGTIVEEYVEHE